MQDFDFEERKFIRERAPSGRDLRPSIGMEKLKFKEMDYKGIAGFSSFNINRTGCRRTNESVRCSISFYVPNGSWDLRVRDAGEFQIIHHPVSFSFYGDGVSRRYFEYWLGVP